jgi:hypothetical protein
MCSPPLGESAEPAFKRRKIKSILMFSTICNLLVLLETIDLNTKQTRITSVIYPPFSDQTETNKNKTKHHINTVFLNTKPWVSTPYASPEGSGATPLEKC